FGFGDAFNENELRRFVLGRTALEGNDHEQTRAVALAACATDVSAHRFRESSGDRPPETGAAIATRRRGIALREGLEQAMDAILWNSDPGIASRQLDDDLSIMIGQYAGTDEPLPLVANLSTLLIRLVRICESRARCPWNVLGTRASMSTA